MTGNNIKFAGDIADRVLLSTIDPQMERPETRKFKIENLWAHVAENRAKYVNAALTILRAYDLAGRPPQDIEPDRFKEWSDRVRSALVWLGCTDPNETRKQVQAEDPEREQLQRISQLWGQVYGREPITAGDIVNQLNTVLKDGGDDGKYELATAISEVAVRKGRIDSRRLGWWLSKQENRRIQGRYFRKNPGGPARRVEWQLVDSNDKGVGFDGFVGTSQLTEKRPRIGNQTGLFSNEGWTTHETVKTDTPEIESQHPVQVQTHPRSLEECSNCPYLSYSEWGDDKAMCQQATKLLKDMQACPLDKK